MDFIAGFAAIRAAAAQRLQAKSAARRIHRNVSSADHGHFFAYLDGGVKLWELIPSHEIDASEEFIGGHDSVQVDSRNAHKHGKARPGAQENSIVFGRQFSDGKGSSYYVIGKYFNTKGFRRR